MFPDALDQERVWTDIKIGDAIYMICVTKEIDEWKIFLTDLIEIWIEVLKEENILSRCQKLNPLLNMEALDCQAIIANVLSNISEYVAEGTVNEIKLRIKLEGGMMKFVLNLSKGTPFEFWSHVTKPLCVSSMEYSRQHKILLDLIRKKDEEIAEYKAEGAELIRKNIETEPFTNDQLKTDVLNPDIEDYTNTFKTVISFYNKLNLLKPRIKKEAKTSSNCAEEDILEYVNVEENCTVAINRNTKSKSHEPTVTTKEGNSESEEDNVKSVPKARKSQRKIKNNVTAICIPNKKLKKSLNNLIL